MLFVNVYLDLTSVRAVHDYVLCVFYYVSVFVNVCILLLFCRKVNKVVYLFHFG